RVFGVAEPMVGQADATNEGNLTVHHENLPVRAVVDLLEAEMKYGVEPADVAAASSSCRMCSRLLSEAPIESRTSCTATPRRAAATNAFVNAAATSPSL